MLDSTNHHGMQTSGSMNYFHTTLNIPDLQTHNMIYYYDILLLSTGIHRNDIHMFPADIFIGIIGVYW